MKHIYATGGTDNKHETPAAMGVMINEVNIPQKSGQYNHKPWRNKESSEFSPKTDHLQSQYRNPLRTQNEENRQLPRGFYTHILINPTQLTDTELTAWMDRLVQARRNRQENKPRPYKRFRKPF